MYLSVEIPLFSMSSSSNYKIIDRAVATTKTYENSQENLTIIYNTSIIEIFFILSALRHPLQNGDAFRNKCPLLMFSSFVTIEISRVITKQSA